jgi:hypothetical protein
VPLRKPRRDRDNQLAAAGFTNAYNILDGM